MSSTKAYTRWTPEEFKLVAAHAIPLIEQRRLLLAKAYFVAQQVALSQDRHKGADDIRRSAAQGTLLKYVDLVRDLPPDQRPRLHIDMSKLNVASILLPELRKSGPSLSKRAVKYPGGVHWTTFEKAQLARYVIERRRDHHDKRVLGALFIAGQEVLFPEDRRRSRDGIYATRVANEKAFEDGKAAMWMLDRGTPAPAMPAPAEAVSAPVVPIAAEPATSPPAARESTLSEAAKAFGDTMMTALDALLSKQAEQIMVQVRERIGRVADEVADGLREHVANMVHASLEKELGPLPSPSVVPTPPPPPAIIRTVH